MQSSLNGVIRPFDTILVGTSPELEMALYTVCFFTRPNKTCPVTVGGTEFLINTSSINYFGSNTLNYADLAIPTAPAAGSSSTPEPVATSSASPKPKPKRRPSPRPTKSTQIQDSSKHSSEEPPKSSASSISWSSLILTTIVLFHLDCDVIFR